MTGSTTLRQVEAAEGAGSDDIIAHAVRAGNASESLQLVARLASRCTASMLDFKV